MNFKERVESHALWWLLGALMTGFVAGISAYHGLLTIGRLHVVSQHQFDQLSSSFTAPIAAPTTEGDLGLLRQQLDAEISLRFEVYLHALHGARLGGAQHGRSLHTTLFVSPAESGLSNNTFRQFRDVGVRQLLEYRIEVSPLNRTEMAAAMQALAKLEMRLKEHPGILGGDDSDFYGLYPDREAFARWVDHLPTT